MQPNEACRRFATFFMRLHAIGWWRIAFLWGLGIGAVSLVPHAEGMNDCEQMRGPELLLGTAYQNAVLHDDRNLQPEQADRQLEDAAVQLSLVLAACGNDRQPRDENNAQCECVPAAENLRALADTVSYAAQKLIRVHRMSEGGEGIAETSATAARISSMAHLYRVVFALSKSLLDPTQSAIYMRAARQEIARAQNAMQTEQQECGCSPEWYESRLAQLSELSEKLAPGGE